MAVYCSCVNEDRKVCELDVCYDSTLANCCYSKISLPDYSVPNCSDFLPTPGKSALISGNFCLYFGYFDPE